MSDTITLGINTMMSTFYYEARYATNRDELYMAERLFIGLFGHGPDTDAFLGLTERLAQRIDQREKESDDD